MRQRWKWISVLIIAALLGVALYSRPRPVPPLPAPIADATPQAQPVSRWPAGIASHTSKTPKSGDHAEIEVCGVGKVNLDSDWTTAGEYLNGLTRSLRLRWLSRLRNSDDYRARATGLYLDGIFNRESPPKDPEAARDDLVQLAIATKDPAVFALAYTNCQKRFDVTASQGACAQLSLDDWTRADADNAAPWLAMAAKARQENDAAAETAAFARAAQAHRYETYNWHLYSFAQAAIPDGITAADRWILTTQIIGVEAAMPMPYQPLFQYCSRDAQMDATVHRQCNALADLLVNKATTLLEFSMGKSLGTRVGWPAERVDKLTQEFKASMQVIGQMTESDPKQQWSCDSVARGNAFMSQWVELGERGLAKQGIEESGETVAELSRKYDEWMAALTREARSAPVPQP
jgi:hypothetical protein